MIFQVLTTISISICMFFFIKLEVPTIVKENININIRSWKKINNLVKTRQTNRIKVIIKSLNLILKASYLSFIQYLNDSVKRLDKNTFEISYVINGKKYKFVTSITKGPVPVLQIINDNEKDVTDIVLPYLGPAYNWHGNRICPKFFGYESLTFELSDGTEVTYKND